MTAPELRAALAALDLTQGGLARLVAVNPRTVRRWLAGDLPVPRAEALLLAQMQRFPAVRAAVMASA